MIRYRLLMVLVFPVCFSGAIMVGTWRGSRRECRMLWKAYAFLWQRWKE